jgi:hypothetical protein
MTSHTATRPGPRRARWRAVAGSELAVLIVAAAIAAGIGWVVLDAPPSIDELAVTNLSEYDITVQVSDGDRDGWTPLATVGRRSTRVVVDVLDQGDTWVFRFTAQGRNGASSSSTGPISSSRIGRSPCRTTSSITYARAERDRHRDTTRQSGETAPVHARDRLVDEWSKLAGWPGLAG